VNAGRYIADSLTANQTSITSLYLGNNTKALADGDYNETVIGYGATGAGTNTVVLGNNAVTKTILNGNVGIGTTEPGAKLDVDGRIKDQTGFIMPVGSVITYGGSTAPTGWLLCNGAAVSRTITYADLFAVIGTTFGEGDGSTTFNVPDLGGIFVRGAGTSTKLTNANNVPFTGTLGTYQEDKMQGHWHNIVTLAGATPALAGAGSFSGGVATTGLDRFQARDPVADLANGPARRGAETNPANLGLNFIIKY
jgi:microcystin-dependent protein